MLRVLTLLGALASLAMAPTGAMAGANTPALEKGKGDKCVEDTQFMRRNHMDLLKHHRNETMRKGIRTTRHSLKQCVECHASSKTGSVAASKDDFCAACHTYAAVKLDCWDCHATKPMKKPANIAASPATAVNPATPAAGSTQ
jgi:hypothetical protein